MKTLIIMLTTCFVTIGGHALRAENQMPDQVKKSLFTYPAEASAQNLEGMVIVSFTVTTTGTVQVLGINASHDTFRNYVIRKLSDIQITPTEEIVGNCYIYKINYRKERPAEVWALGRSKISN